jgi:hypothetical protein
VETEADFFNRIGQKQTVSAVLVSPDSECSQQQMHANSSHSPHDPAVVMFLSTEHYPNLISWSGWKVEQLWSQRVVPHVEVGFPGDVSLDMIIEVHIWEDANPEGFCRLTDLYNRLERNSE